MSGSSGFSPEGLSVLPLGFRPAAFFISIFPLRRVPRGSCEQPKGKEPEMAKENERKEAKERKRKQDGVY